MSATDLIFMLGALLIAGGAFWAWHPAGPIVLGGGVCLLAAGYERGDE